MTVLSAKERGDMVEELLPQATNLVVLVHGDGGVRDVHQAIARLDAGQRDAMLVILAGLVDPDRPLSSALGWLDFTEEGELTVPPWQDTASVRDLVPEPELEDDETFVDETAVQNYIKGIPGDVSVVERLQAVVEAAAQGISYLELDERHGFKAGRTSTFISRLRKQYVADGKPFPAIVRPLVSEQLSAETVVAIRERSAAGDTDMDIGLAFGVQPKAVAAICRGRTHARAGGPIREAKSSKPGRATRVDWAHGQERFAEAG